MKRTSFYAFARTFLAWFFRILMPIKVIDAAKMPVTGKIILCCNHMSMTDPLRLAFSIRRQVFFMAKSELFQNRLVSAVIRALGAFPVSRGKSDVRAIETAEQHLNDGHILGIFIEGTRSRDGELLRPKSGAVLLAHRCNAPLIPCCITTKGGGLPRLFHTCYVSYGDVIRPDQLGIEKGTPSEYRQASHFVMERIHELRKSALNKNTNKEYTHET